MNGIYKVFIDGELVAEQKNKLTLLGRSNALKTMLGLVPSFAGSLGIGISSRSNGTVNQYLDMSDLDLSVGRYPITAASLGQNDDEDVLVYTSRITDTSRYYITELGLYSNKLSSNFEADNRIIFNFESGDPLKLSDDTYIGSTIIANTPHFISNTIDSSVTGSDSIIAYRIGSNALKLTQEDTVTFNDSVLDMRYVAPYDNFVLAAYFSAAYSVNVVFSDGVNTATYAFASSGVGYRVISRQKNQGTGHAAVDWSKITSVTIYNASTGTTILDGLRVKKYKTLDSVEGLVSRAVLSAPIEKPLGSVIDIQYLLEMQMDM